MQVDPVYGPDVTEIIVGLLPTLFILLILYVYFSIILMILARKTGTPNGWMAWIPLLNLVLMCQIGRQSGWLALLLLIPLVNIIVGVIVWMAIARARGKPGWTGILVLIPLVGLFVPAYLAMGEASAPQAAASFGTGDAQQTAAPAGRVCPHCGTPPAVDEMFCGNCGKQLPPAEPASFTTAATARVQPAPKKSHAGLIVAAAAVVLLGLGGWFIYSAFISYSAPARVKPELPERMAGTLTEFPVDTAAAAPARPASVLTDNFEQKSKRRRSGDVKVPQDWLPPGVESRELPERARAITSTQYRTSPQAPPVNVHVLEPPPGGSAGEKISGEIVRATRGEQTGVRVKSPAGRVYRGSRIETPRTVIFVLVNQDTDNVVIIYAPEPEAVEIAARLAGNVGNGDGLNDYPEIQESLWVLPPLPPAGLVLLEANTFTRADFESGLGEIEATTGNSAEAREALSRIRQLLPERLTAARYNDNERQEWNVAISEFASPLRAWTTWMLLRGALAAGVGTRSVTNGDGIYADTDEGRLLVFQKGPYIVFLGGPRGVAIDRLMSLAGLFQV